MIIKTPDKEAAFRAVINTWLKDPRVYCNACGMTFMEGMPPCCDAPQLGNNWDICAALIEQNKGIRESRMNKFASTEDKSMRWGVSMPVDLYRTLNKFCKENGDAGLFEEKSDLHWFAKKFKVFAIPQEV